MDSITTATSTILQTGLLGAIVVILAVVIIWLQKRNDSDRKCYEDKIKLKDDEIRTSKLELLNDWKNGSIVKDQVISEVKDVLKTLVESFNKEK
jgi:sensor domain CHASE-containing protein